MGQMADQNRSVQGASDRLGRLGAFLPVRQLAEGGMGIVWEARHARTKVVVAIKAMTDDRARDAAGRAAFRREVRAVAGLSHPNIVHVYDFGEVSDAESRSGPWVAGSPWVAMELAHGGSLKDMRGQLGWPQLQGVLVALLEALGHAHARGVIHRDLKPGNVLIRNALPDVQLADFGLAWLGERGNVNPAGTPGYMAPEQIQGSPFDLGPWTDLYGLGCLAFALACGRPPFEGSGLIQEIGRAHV